MENLQKKQIQKHLMEYVKRHPSQNKAATTLNDVSSATISQILNEKWDLVADSMWRNISSQIGVKSKEWVLVDTVDFLEIQEILSDAQKQSMVMSFVGDAGSGKSAATKAYKNENKHVYLLSCNEYWQKTDFLNALATSMGKDVRGYNINQMMVEIIKIIKSVERPLIIMDEGDKLKDQVLRFFITLYNNLEDHCGIVICATDHLEKKIKRGLTLNKQGYQEMYSRLGRKFIPLDGVTFTDVDSICKSNGENSAKRIKEIWNDCDRDLRRVKRLILAARLENKKQQNRD